MGAHSFFRIRRLDRGAKELGEKVFVFGLHWDCHDFGCLIAGRYLSKRGDRFWR
jgi:hypothetical protein